MLANNTSLDGDLLPLQLIFQGMTDACLPPHSLPPPFGFHLTKSANHWSNQQTMKEYVDHIILPFRKKMIEKHSILEGRQDIVLVLDVWAVHISAEFRQFIAEQHPYIHLVYIPPNCISKLQVADYALNYPFKHGVKRRFDAWAAEKVAEQINAATT